MEREEEIKFEKIHVNEPNFDSVVVASTTQIKEELKMLLYSLEKKLKLLAGKKVTYFKPSWIIDQKLATILNFVIMHM